MSGTIRTVQAWGVLTKVVTLGLGVLQTAIILRILGPERYGVVGIIVSLGALVGVSQHVGVVDAAIREIAVADTAARRAAVFWTSLWFRLAATVPISVVLALAAPWIATRVYPLPDVRVLLWLTSALLVLHGIQGVLGGAYSGQRAFGILYAFQAIMAAVNVPLFAGLAWLHGVRGFFEAAIVAAVLFSVLLALFLRRALGGPVAHPSLADMRVTFRDIVHTGAWTYVARILSVAWQRLPILLLGRWADPSVVGLFTAATTFGSKLQLMAAALSEVNLAFLSHAFAEGRDAFRRLARRTLADVGAVTLLGAFGLIVFAEQLVPLLAGRAYLGAVPFVAAITWGYAAFAYVDIGANTLFVPARRAHLRALSFAALCGVTLTLLAVGRAQPVPAALVSVAAGGAAGLVVAIFLAASRMRIGLVPAVLFAPTVIAVAVTSVPGLPLAVRAALFVIVSVWTIGVANQGAALRVLRLVSAVSWFRARRP